MICATSRADVIAIAIRCADYRFNANRAGRIKRAGKITTRRFDKPNLGIAISDARHPERKREISPQADESHKIRFLPAGEVLGPRRTGVVVRVSG
jgi:hypothetical protein